MTHRLPIRIALTLSLALVALMALAGPVMAADGVGLSGRTDDLMITYWGFGVIAFFIIFPIVMSLIQGRLDSRKERAREDRARVRAD